MGVNCDGCNMLRVCSAWRNRRSQRFRGNDVSVPQRIATKWSLNVWIAFSALFHQWWWGGMSWYVMLLVLMASLKSLEHSLSRICCLGVIPTEHSQSTSTWYARIISPDILFFIAFTGIALLSLSVRTIMYWHPLLDFFGKRPG